MFESGSTQIVILFLLQLVAVLNNMYNFDNNIWKSKFVV